jgi:drug/metabolite transporter (DMT)-like permease
VTRPHAPWQIHAALAGAQVGFALYPIFGKLALATIPPLPFAAFRVTAAAALLEIIRRAQRGETIRRADRPRILLYALLGVSFNQILFICGLSLTSAIHTTILTATIPVFTLAAAVLLRRETLTARAAGAIGLAGAGALALLNAHQFEWSNGSFRGDLLIIANSISYSLYLVLSRRALADYRATAYTAACFRYGSVLIVLAAIPDLIRFSPSRTPPLAWTCLGAVIVLCTVIPYLLNSWALARTHASQVAFYVFLQPLIATALAIPILGENLTAKAVVASALILAGLAVSVARGRRGAGAAAVGIAAE